MVLAVVRKSGRSMYEYIFARCTFGPFESATFAPEGHGQHKSRNFGQEMPKNWSSAIEPCQSMAAINPDLAKSISNRFTQTVIPFDVWIIFGSTRNVFRNEALIFLKGPIGNFPGASYGRN